MHSRSTTMLLAIVALLAVAAPAWAHRCWVREKAGVPTMRVWVENQQDADALKAFGFKPTDISEEDCVSDPVPPQPPPQPPPPKPPRGCMNPQALNFDEDATIPGPCAWPRKDYKPAPADPNCRMLGYTRPEEVAVLFNPSRLPTMLACEGVQWPAGGAFDFEVKLGPKQWLALPVALPGPIQVWCSDQFSLVAEHLNSEPCRE